MSLVNTALPQYGVSAGGKRKYTVALSDIVAGGAFTTVDINLDTLPPGAIHLASRIKHSASVAGPSISAATARLYFNAVALGSGALDVFQAPGTTDGTHAITSVTPVAGSIASTGNVLMMRVTSTGANLSVATAGSIDASIEFLVLQLP